MYGKQQSYVNGFTEDGRAILSDGDNIDTTVARHSPDAGTPADTTNPSTNHSTNPRTRRAHRDRAHRDRTDRDRTDRTDRDRADFGWLKQADVVAFNSEAEKTFVALVRTLAPCSVSDAVREAAFELNISVETAKRYLIKHTARRAEFVIACGVVQVRGNYSS